MQLQETLQNILYVLFSTVFGESCASLYKSGTRFDGVYTINSDDLGSFQVRCDMQTDGGGWTVFQRRQDASVDFYRGWQDYKNGFGDLNGNFWLGLNKIHRLTKSGQNVLRVDLTDWTSDTAYAKYGSFSVASESDGYKLNLGSFSGKYDLININFIKYGIRGRLHGAFSTPGLNSALLTGLKFFAITWTISSPG